MLVVEDDSDILTLMWEVLQGQGYFVLGAMDGRDGLLQVRAHAPDLVIIDLMLPILSGIGLATALRADPRARAVPLVAISGALRPLGAARALFTTFLAKPFHVKDLLHTVAVALDGEQ
ncbi:MAG TPA: response regulator [Chloroflexota bacterium]|nr:response regulator [Chloroflexota bacterium]